MPKFAWSPESRPHQRPAPTIQDILYYFDGPKMVIALDERSRQLLGIAVDEDDNETTLRWLFVTITPEKIIGLIERGYTLRQIFSSSMVDMFDIDRSWTALQVWSMYIDDVPDEYLPDAGAKLPELTPEAVLGIVEKQQRIISSTARFAHTRLLFDGNRVVGTRGIDVTFAAKSLQEYQNIITLEHLSRQEKPIPSSGPIPWLPETALMLIDMPRGSVGFELIEEGAGTRVTPSPLAGVVNDVTALLDAAATGDDEYTELAVDFDARVIRHAHDLFSEVKRVGAIMKLESNGREYIFEDERLEQAVERTAVPPRQTEEIRKGGVLIGFLPTGRRFEFRTEDGAMLKGKIDRRADLDFIAAFFRQRCEASIRVATMQRHGRITYGYMLLTVFPIQ